MESNKSNLFIVYLLATIGDLISGGILVITVIYSAQMGLSTIEIGLIGSAYGISYVIMPAILGRIGDRITRKSSLLIANAGLMITALILLLVVLQPVNYLFIGFFSTLIFFGIIAGFFWPAIEAYISENTEHSSKAHEHAIANFCLAWSIGYTLAPLFAGYFSDVNVIIAFVFSFVCYLVCFLLVLIGLPSIKPTNNNKHKIKNKGENPELRNTNNEVDIPKSLVLISGLLLMGVFAYATISKIILSYFPNYAVIPNGLGWTGTLTGQVMLFYGLGRTLYFIVGRYIKNSFAAITQSILGIGVCLIFVFLFTDVLLLLIILFFFGFFVGRAYFVSLELLLKYEEEGKGAKAGLFESVIGFGSAFTPFLAGVIATIELKLPFIIFAVLAFSFVLVHLFLKKKIKSSN